MKVLEQKRTYIPNFQISGNMEIRIQKIYPNEIQMFSESNEYLNFEHLPISKKRLISYQNNPRKIEHLPILYLGFLDEKLIGYRSVFQDQYYVDFDKKIGCIWTSGVWTHPEYRRKGWAKKLLDEVIKDYNGFVFSTNLASETQELMRTQNLLTPFLNLKGHRFYFRLSSEVVLPSKSSIFFHIRPVLKFIDNFGNFFLDFRLKSTKREFKEIQNAVFSSDLEIFISKHNKDSIFKRNIEEFKWIVDNPWVEQRKEDSEFDKKYHFTTSAIRFQTHAKVMIEKGKIKGFLLYTIKNETMKILYFFTESEKERESFTSFLLSEIYKNKMSTVLMVDENLIDLCKKKGGYIYSKEWKKVYFIGKKFLEGFPEIRDKDIFMGDGDTVFI